MIAGLPGTGISGIFYLLAALLMPILELGRVLRKRSNRERWCVVRRQIGMSAGMIGALWGAYLLLGLLFPDTVIFNVGAAAANAVLESDQSSTPLNVILPVVIFLFGFATLAFTLIAIEVLRLVVRWGGFPVVPRS